MSQLTNDQKQLLFDYCLGLTSDKEAAEAEKLIASDNQAAQIHSNLQAALSPLASIEPEPCPDSLAEGTVFRLNSLANSGQSKLEQLIADEQKHTVAVRTPLWANLGRFAAVAAVLVIAVGVFFSQSSYARQRYYELQCRRNLARMYQGIQMYGADNDGKMPAVAASAGSPWWKVGYQGDENHSTTRNMWLLVKGGYVKPDDFGCPGSTKTAPARLTKPQIAQYNDFPSRNYVTFSFRIPCYKTGMSPAKGRRVLVADMSPLFENLPDDFSRPLKLELSKELLKANSINHNRRGQNVMYCDGTIKFIKSRHADISKDDIYTLRNITVYQGVESPDCESDVFIAP